MKKLFFSAVLMLSLMLTLSAQIQVAPGMKKPELRVSWINGTPSELPADPAVPYIEVLLFTDFANEETPQVLRLIENIESKYRRSSVKQKMFFRTVVNTPSKTACEILDRSPEPYTALIGSDDTGKSFRNFVIAAVPYVYIIENGVIRWSGLPAEMETVLDSITDGSFSEDKYKELARIHAEMQSSLRAGLPDVASRTADKALDILPTDYLAVQMKLYAMALKNDFKGQTAFLKKIIQENPGKSARFSLMLLDSAIRSGDSAAWQEAVQTAVAESVHPNDQLNLVAFLAERSPKYAFPAKTALELCRKCLNSRDAETDAAFRADALEVAADNYRCACNLNAMVKMQSEAVKVREEIHSPFLQRSTRRLEYFKSLQQLSSGK